MSSAENPSPVPIRQVLEGALFMAGRSLNLEELTKICHSGNVGLVRKEIEVLKEEYEEREGAIRIYHEYDEYAMRVVPKLEKEVSMLAPIPDISPAILKTLALIAYEQPITQSRLVKERGNKIYKYVKVLKKKEFISAEKHGRTKMLRTTSRFKEYFNIKDLRELKKVKPDLSRYQPEKD